VMTGWVWFRAKGFARAIEIFEGLAGLNGFSGLNFATHVVLYPTTVTAMLIGAVLSVVSWIPRPQLAPVADQAADSIKIAVLFALCIVTIAAGSYSPFLYFRF